MWLDVQQIVQEISGTELSLYVGCVESTQQHLLEVWLGNKLVVDFLKILSDLYMQLISWL